MSDTQNPILALSDDTRAEFRSVLSEEGNKGQVVRITLGSGCGGMRLGLALDDPNDAEVLLTEGDIVVIADKDVRAHIETHGGLTINVIDQGEYGKGFKLDLAVKPATPAGSCGSCCGGC